MTSARNPACLPAAGRHAAYPLPAPDRPAVLAQPGDQASQVVDHVLVVAATLLRRSVPRDAERPGRDDLALLTTVPGDLDRVPQLAEQIVGRERRQDLA